MSPESLDRLAKSVMQIRTEPLATLLQFSPRFGVMSLMSAIRILERIQYRKQYATAAPLGDGKYPCLDQSRWLTSNAYSDSDERLQRKVRTDFYSFKKWNSSRDY